MINPIIQKAKKKSGKDAAETDPAARPPTPPSDRVTITRKVLSSASLSVDLALYSKFKPCDLMIYEMFVSVEARSQRFDLRASQQIEQLLRYAPAQVPMRIRVSI